MARIDYEDDEWVDIGTRLRCFGEGHGDGATMVPTDEKTENDVQMHECTECGRELGVGLVVERIDDDSELRENADYA